MSARVAVGRRGARETHVVAHGALERHDAGDGAQRVQVLVPDIAVLVVEVVRLVAQRNNNVQRAQRGFSLEWRDRGSTKPARVAKHAHPERRGGRHRRGRARRGER